MERRRIEYSISISGATGRREEKSTYHRLGDGALLRLVKLGVVQLLVKQPSLLPHLRMFSRWFSAICGLMEWLELG